MEISISDQQQTYMLHALGVSHDSSGIEIRRGVRYKNPERSYRNHYVVKDSPAWNDLVDKKLADMAVAMGSSYYYVTVEGKEYLKEIGYCFLEEDEEDSDVREDIISSISTPASAYADLLSVIIYIPF